VTITGLLWDLLNPAAVLFYLLILGSVLFLFGRRRLARATLLTATLSLSAVGLLPIAEGLAAILENRFLPPEPMPQHVDGIIVLGGASRLALSHIHGQPVLNSHAQRLTAFAALARRYPQARLAYTGGGRSDEYDLSEHEVARTFLSEIGVDTDRVTFERTARNTYENAVQSKKLLKPRDGETWLLVTSALHMPRAMGSFRAAGWQPLPYPAVYLAARKIWSDAWRVDFPARLWLFEKASHEWVGLVFYRLLERSDEIFPSADNLN
jgi:uncharacterized SAM-binding protein YcdF (DUF218 family)